MTKLLRPEEKIRYVD